MFLWTIKGIKIIMFSYCTHHVGGSCLVAIEIGLRQLVYGDGYSASRRNKMADSSEGGLMAEGTKFNAP